MEYQLIMPLENSLRFGRELKDKESYDILCFDPDNIFDIDGKQFIVKTMLLWQDCSSYWEPVLRNIAEYCKKKRLSLRGYLLAFCDNEEVKIMIRGGKVSFKKINIQVSEYKKYLSRSPSS